MSLLRKSVKPFLHHPLPPRHSSTVCRYFHSDYTCAKNRNVKTHEVFKVIRERLKNDLSLSENTQQTLKDVLEGRVPVKVSSDPFKFKCTACGECCRRFGQSLYIGPDDIWRITRGQSAVRYDLTTTSKLLHVARDGVRVEAQAIGRGFVLPICRLQTVTRERGDRRCIFAVAVSTLKLQQPPPPEKQTEDKHATHSESNLHQSTHTETYINASGRPRLICGLSQESMPTKCASFPLGRGIDDIAGHFFAIDGCEGLSFPSQPKTSTADNDVAVKGSKQLVSDYVDRNALDERWRRSDWFKECRKRASEAILGSPFTASAKINARIVTILGLSWYDFDSITADEKLGDWCSATKRIDVATDRFVLALNNAAEQYQANLPHRHTLAADHPVNSLDSFKRPATAATVHPYASVNPQSTLVDSEKEWEVFDLATRDIVESR
eukprot:CFRG3571T1